MKAWLLIIFSLMLVLLISFNGTAEKGEGLPIPLYEASLVRDDSLFGFEEFSILFDESNILVEEGYLRRVFCLAPENRSPLEIIKNYEKAIKDGGGTIVFFSHRPQEITVEERSFKDIFQEVRKDPG